MNTSNLTNISEPASEAGIELSEWVSKDGAELLLNFEPGPGFGSIAEAKTWLDRYLRGAAAERSQIKAERNTAD